MAENKGVLPSSNVNTLGNANNKWENVYANKFTGALTGNASTASSAAQLTTARSINGTNFNGTGNITTANWGTARNISIADATAANTGTGVSVNGSGNVTLKLPATIKANLTGNADNATKWNGMINDLATENNTDSWIPVLKDNKLQHTTKANMAVGQATRDSAGQQINTTYIKGLSISNNALIYTKGDGTTGHVDLIPAGTMWMFAGNTIPAGWLLCDGSAVSRTNYAKLFSAIGTTWGAGDGSTTFNLPNSIGRFAEGAATSGSYKSAGLPNITGTIALGNLCYLDAETKGAFITNGFSTIQSVSAMGGTNRFNKVEFYASRSSGIYGNSTTVQPNSFTVRYIIKY